MGGTVLLAAGLEGQGDEKGEGSRAKEDSLFRPTMEPDFASSDPFERLGIPPDSDKKAIRRAYKALVRKYRPETHAEIFQQIRAAYDEALAAASWREQMQGWEEEDDVGEGDVDEGGEEEQQTFEPIFDTPWPEDRGIEIPEDSRLAEYLGHAAWTDPVYREQGLELEQLLRRSGARAARLRFEEMEAELVEQAGEEAGRLTWLRLGVFLARSLAPAGPAEDLDALLQAVDDEENMDEECFDVLEFAIVILRARGEVEKVNKKKYPEWFTSFVFSCIDSDPAEINEGLARVRRHLLRLRKRKDIDWLDTLAEDMTNFSTLLHILLHRHALGLREIAEEGLIHSRDEQAFDLAVMDQDLEQLERQLDRQRRLHMALNGITFVTFLLAILGGIVVFVTKRFAKVDIDLLWLAISVFLIFLLGPSVDRSYAYRFLLRPRLRRFLMQHEAPVALLTALIRLHEGALPGLDYYLTAIETDPKLPPRYRKRDFEQAELPHPYLGNLSPR